MLQGFLQMEGRVSWGTWRKQGTLRPGGPVLTRGARDSRVALGLEAQPLANSTPEQGGGALDHISSYPIR